LDFSPGRKLIPGATRACSVRHVGGGNYGEVMSRFRLLSTNEQEEALLGHCRDARYVWNLAVEQQRHWQPGRKAPGYVSSARS
jgi:hypothetical protein